MAAKGRNNRRNRSREGVLRAAARSVERRRENRRRWGRLAVLVLGILAVGGALVFGGREMIHRCFLDNEFFAIRHLDITTDGSLSAERIREYAGVSEGMNLFRIHPEEVREQLLTVAVVENAQVGRRFPDTLVIELSERVAVARLGRPGSGTPLATDATGHVLGPSSVRATLPVVTGIRDKALRPGDVIADPMMGEALRILEICSHPALRKEFMVVGVNVSSEDWMTVDLDSGEQVLLSRENVLQKLERLPLMRDAARRRGLDLAVYDMTANENYAGRSSAGTGELP